MEKKIPIVFFGTPEFSVPILKSLHESSDFEIRLVVSQPDRPSGRKLKLTPSPVKVYAVSQGLKFVTPETCKSDDFIQLFKSLDVHGAVVVAFGQILNQKLLNLCPANFINIHASLLPRWRGAAPIHRSIMAGDKTTGVCLQVMVKKLDAGDVIAELRTDIDPEEDSVELHDRLSLLGADLALKSIPTYFSGDLIAIPQDESLVTYASKIEKDEAWVDWTKNSQQIWNHIRGLALGPGGVTQFNNKRLKITKAKPLSLSEYIELQTDHKMKNEALNKDKPKKQAFRFGDAKPSEVISLDDKGFYVICGEVESSFSVLHILEVQPESKSRMSAHSFIHGSGLKVGNILSN